MIDILFNPQLVASVNTLVAQVVRICIYMFTLGVVVYFITFLFRISGDTENRNLAYHIFVIVGAGVALATYQIWAVWIGKLFVMLARAIYDLEHENVMQQLMTEFYGKDNPEGLRFNILNYFSLQGLSGLTQYLLSIVYQVFVTVQIILQIFLYAIGPVAIILSLFPTLYDVFKSWLLNFIAVNFWSVSVAILFRFMKIVVESPAFKEGAANNNYSYTVLVLSVVSIVMLGLIPKFSLLLFRFAAASADIGMYGTAISSGLIINKIWGTTVKTGQRGLETGIRTGVEAVNKALKSLTKSNSPTVQNIQFDQGGGQKIGNDKLPFGGEGSQIPSNDENS